METPELFKVYFLIIFFTHIEANVTGERESNGQANNHVVCRDNENNQVDWFILYKEPKPNGSDYIIMTSSDSSADWKSFHGGFIRVDGAPALENTLHPLNDSKVTYAMYSDQPPTKQGAASEPWGHAKGVLAKLDKSGFFLAHSLPNFPAPRREQGKYNWSLSNGQIFLCVTFEANDAQWTNVLTHFSNLVPYKYEKSVDLKQPEPRFISHIDLFSQEGVKFRLFSKYGRNGTEIYEDTIAKYFSSSLDVATWRNGAGGKLHSECKNKDGVQDVTRVVYTATSETGDIKSAGWKSTKDHSKWAVSRDGEKVFCVGDLNRMESQKNRNGGVICFQNSKVAKTFKSMVMSTDCENRVQ